MKTYQTIRSESFCYTSTTRALAAQLRMMDDTGSGGLAGMGNFPEVLVTTPANAARLVKMGYEVMK